MENKSAIIETGSKYGRGAYRMMNHFQKYAKKCIELDIPAPFAAEVTRHASDRLKDFGFKEKKKLCQCLRCNLDLTSTKTVSFRLSMWKKRAKKRNKKSVELIVVCKGCGAEMKGGALAIVNRRNQDALMSSDESLRRESQRFSGQSALSTPGTSFRGTPTISDRKVEKKLSSSARRRNLTSKLQRLLASQTPTRKENNLQGFLEAFKINT